MRRARSSLSLAVLSLLGLAFLCSPIQAADSKQVDEARAQARQAEHDLRYSEACSWYAFLLTHKSQATAEDRESFQRCLRHLHRTRRHQDASYRTQVLELEPAVARRVYGEVLNQLHTEYEDEGRTGINRLFQQGIAEFRLALLDEAFQKLYCSTPGSAGTVEAFISGLQTKFNKPLKTVEEAQTAVFRIGLAARAQFGIRPTVTILEFACGACNALDEHTYYMTPRQYGEDLASLRGDTVGVGIDVEVTADRKLLVSQVVVNSPASRAGFRGGEEIVRIDRQAADKLTADGAHDRLKGKVGSTVELEIIADGKTRVLTLIRQPVSASVVNYRLLGDPAEGIGYLHLAAFNQNTLTEVDEALRNLELQGMKVLILDLRDNAGGLFDAAVQVAERFLWEGAYIVSTKGKVRDVKRVSRNPNPLAIPLIVLVNNNTASAAEILAGALKENTTEDMQPRAKVIGVPTFGKGTVQHMVELKSVQAGGIRITWAKFFSPRNNAYHGIGVEPHFKVADPNQQIGEAINQARELTNRMMTMMR